MNDISSMKKNEIAFPEVCNLSSYDPIYPISLLNESVNNCFKDAEMVMNKIYQKVSEVVPIATQGQQSLKKGCRYVVQMSDEMISAIDNGTVKLSYNKKGETYAQLLTEKGKFGTKLPIKKEDFAVGMNPVILANTLQMKAMQDQLNNISEQISLIDSNVKAVIQGQQNDRIGQYYSGVSLFMEARNMDNEQMKKAVIAQSLRALSDSIFQLKLNMDSDIQYLINEEYKHAKGKRVELIDSHMRSINQCFAYIHQATLMKAGIYCDQKEIGSMATVLDEYSHFIEETIVKNSGLLAQCDVSDTGGTDGIWQTRAKFKLDTTDLKQQLLMKEKTLYIGVEKGEE
ncbi:MAG: hypothetical protein Q4E53_05800 [Eubacteriales bacterium]|nr:hypothetical protein [Eubacteriales bacterium]